MLMKVTLLSLAYYNIWSWFHLAQPEALAQTHLCHRQRNLGRHLSGQPGTHASTHTVWGDAVWDRNGVGWREIGREGRGWAKELRGRRMTEEGVERLHLLIFVFFIFFVFYVYFLSDQALMS